MRTFLALVAALILGGGVAWADGCPTVVSSTTPYACTRTVFNDSGSTLTSGRIVVYDQADTDFNVTGAPYVITSTTQDDPWTAGVIDSASCADQTLCSMIYYGYTNKMLLNDSGDAAPVDTHIGNSATAGIAGGYATAADTCRVGTVIDMLNLDGADNQPISAWVDVQCD